MTYTNFNSTTLSGDITAGTTSIGVTNGSIFPTSNFNLLIEDELVFCTSRSSNTLTCVRGVDGSTAAAHSSGTRIYLLLSGSYTNRNLITRNKLQHVFTSGAGGGGGSSIETGLVADLPTAGTAGNLYMSSNGIYSYLDNGSSYDKFGITNKFVEPLESEFAWANQGSYTADDTHGGIFLQSAGNTTDNIAGMLKAVPSAPYTITIAFIPMYIAVNFTNAGIFLRNSSNGKILVFGFSNGGIIVQWFDSYTIFNGSVYSGSSTPISSNIMWLRLTDDGSNHKFSWSTNGLHFFEIASDGNNDFLVPTHVGFYLNHIATGGARRCGMHLLHWDEV